MIAVGAGLSGGLVGLQGGSFPAADKIEQDRRAAIGRHWRELRAAPGGRRFLIAAIENHELARIAEILDLPPQDAHAERMERGNFRLTVQPFAEQFGGASLHFAGGFIGERDGQNAFGLGSVADKIGDAKCYYARFARACAGQYQERAGEGFDGLALSIVERHGEKIGRRSMVGK